MCRLALGLPTAPKTLSPQDLDTGCPYASGCLLAYGCPYASHCLDRIPHNGLRVTWFLLQVPFQDGIWTIQYNIHLMKKIPADTAATEITVRQSSRTFPGTSPTLPSLDISQRQFSRILALPC